MFGALLLLASLLGAPAELGTLRGKVLFEDEQRPAVGASVVLLGTQIGSTVAANGEFTIPGIPEGNYDVRISYVGYRREDVRNIVIQSAAVTELNIVLRPSPFNLDAVVVTGTLNKHILKDAPVLTEVIGARELSVIGSKNLTEVLAAQTGIEVGTGIGQTQNASLHGLNDNHVLVLVDGERVSGKVDGAIDLGQVPISMVDRIEVVKGPLSSIYGSDALGGVVNILTKNPQGSEVAFSGTFGSLERTDLNLSGSHVLRSVFGPDGDVRAIANISYNRFGGVDYLKADNFMEMPGSDRLNLNLKVNGQITPHFSLDAKADHYRDELEWLAGDIGITFLRDFARNEKLTLTGIGTYVFSDALSLKLTANKSQNDRRSWETTGAGYLTRDSYGREVVQSYRLQGTMIPYARSILTVGAEYSDETMNSSRFSGGVRSVSNRVLYAEDEWDLGVGTLAIGGRYSVNSSFGAVFAPRISAVVPVTGHTSLRASYGRGYREPSLLELHIDFDHSSVGYILKGNPDLQPEDSHGFTLSAQYNREDLVWFRITYFLNTLRNLIDYYAVQNSTAGSAAILSYRNVDRAVTEGVDVDVDLEPVEGALLSLGYSHVRAVDGNGYLLPFRTPNSLNLKLNGRLPVLDATVDLRMRWFDRKPINDDQVNRGIYTDGEAPQYSYVPAYQVSDVRVSARPMDRVELFAGVNNLFDTVRYPFGQIKPRQLYGGLNVTIR